MDLESKITVAAISAGSAIAGAVISQIVAVIRDWLDKKHQRNTLLRDKYEELVDFVTSSQMWASEVSTAMTLKEIHNTPPIYSRKAVNLSYIYFPLLRRYCEKYLTACVKFQITLIDNHEHLENIDCGTQAVHKNQIAVEQASTRLRETRQDLDEQIVKYAKKYAKA